VARAGPAERFVWNKLITGAFRVGASSGLVQRALAQASGVDEGAISHRLMGGWEPTSEFFRRLVSVDVSDAVASRPYPFYLAHPLDAAPETLGEPAEWLAEWKWDGIRAQLIRRTGRTFLWSRGEELLSGRFPEVEDAAALLPEGTVLDGELLPWLGEGPLPFAQLQRRIGRKTLSRKILIEVPVVLVAYDLLEESGEDLRSLPLTERRGRLRSLLARTPSAGRLALSPAVEIASWTAPAALGGLDVGARDPCSNAGAAAMASDAPGLVEVEGGASTVDAVLMYAQPGPRRADPYHYTFGVWDGDLEASPPIRLSDAEIRRVDAFVRRNTLEKHGPVRVVKPELVFELAFEGIRPSTRHKSGVAVRFPRITRWRTDKRPEEADTLGGVRELLEQ
jgi:DNA ligase-1